MDHLIKQLRQKSEQARLGGGAAAIAKEHAKGKLTARERLDLLFDPGSFIEVGLLTDHTCHNFGLEEKSLPGDAVVTGYGLVEERPVFAFAQDATVMGGALGGMHSQKICTIMDLALKAAAPIVGLNDSAGARVQEGADSLAGYGLIFKRNVEASGVVPQISAIMGNCAGGAVYSPAMTDVIFMVQKSSYMFITGPKVIKSVTGEAVDMQTLGGARIHSKISGNCDLACKDDAECLRQIRRLLSFLPSNCGQQPPRRPSGSPNAFDPEIHQLIPEDRKKFFDVRRVIERLVDQGDFLEIKAQFAPNVVCGLGRVDGYSVGLVANQSRCLGGALDSDASDKASRFVRFCDAFNIPLVSLVDVPGYLPGVKHEYSGIIRHGAKMIYAYAEATVPKITIILRKAYGGAYQAMCSKQLGADQVWAWPSAEIAVMGAEGAVDIVFAKEVAAAVDPAAARQARIEEYRDKFTSPYYTAKLLHVDAVIEPGHTRPYLIQALLALRHKREQKPVRRHGNIPL
ncbi:MAG: acyl-CoA carboxylase subunit beta [Desulfarculus sp.]|jgi:acetyl-CoA carboxylase carboxyltransferase component|nr:MAG: acyl-CoA carboxylase subunit beta [Desulfarculus sp.]